MLLKICCKNIVKIVCTYHFLKKKKVEWNCGNDIAEIGGKKNFAIGLWQCHCRNKGVKKKKIGIVKSGMEFGNAIATIPFHFFFFFLRNDKCTQFLQQILSGRLLLLD